MIDGEDDIRVQVRQRSCKIACGAVDILSADIAVALLADELRELAVFDFIRIHHAVCGIITVHIVVGDVRFQSEGAASADKLERCRKDIVLRAKWRQGDDVGAFVRTDGELVVLDGNDVAAQTSRLVRGPQEIERMVFNPAFRQAAVFDLGEILLKNDISKTRIGKDLRLNGIVFRLLRENGGRKCADEQHRGKNGAKAV